MIAITKVLFELLTPDQRLEQAKQQVKSDNFNAPSAEAARRAVRGGAVPKLTETDIAKKDQVDLTSKPEVTQNETRAEAPAAAAAVENKAVVAAPVKSLAKKAMTGENKYTRTFNSLPNKGRDLHIAGTGQKGPINPADQRTFDAAHAKLAGVPAKIAKENAPHEAVARVTKALQQNPREMSGGEHAMEALKHGAKATGDAVKTGGEAIVSGAKKVAEHLGEHPLAAAATGIVGAGAALGLRRILGGKKKQ